MDLTTGGSNDDRLATVYDGLAAQLDECAAVLCHDLEVAEAALVRAAEKVNEIRRNLDDVLRYRDAHRNSAMVRRASQRVSFSRTLPVELLCAVFQIFVGETASLWDAWKINYDIDKHRRAAPFILSAVCRRWRTVALATPSLWSYIALPAPTTVSGCHKALAYISTVISRSGSTALEIAVDWDSLSRDKWTDLGPICQPLLSRIADVASRWKVAFLHLSNAAATHESLDVFRRVMPMLEELVVCREDGSDNPWETDFPLYLPHCPKLRRMRTDGCHVVWTPPRNPIALVHLELDVFLPNNVIWDLLQSLPILETLILAVRDDDDLHVWTPPADQKLHLRALRILGIHWWADQLLSQWVGRMEFPNLQACLFECIGYVDLHPFLAAFADTITTLTLSTLNITTEPETIPDFSKLKHLVIRQTDDPGYATTFLTLARTDLWPELEVVELHDLEVSADLAVALIKFVRARRPKRLNTVRLESCSAPAWFSEQLELFLRDSDGGLQ